MEFSANISPIFQLLFLALFVIPGIFFLITLQNKLKSISVENRKMPPVNVWLLLIPIFNVVWQFIVVDKIAKSITAECMRLNIPVKNAKPTYNIGLAWNICNFITFIPFLGLSALVTFILYWVKVAEFKRLIQANQDNYMLDAERNIFHANKTV